MFVHIFELWKCQVTVGEPAASSRTGQCVSQRHPVASVRLNLFMLHNC